MMQSRRMKLLSLMAISMMLAFALGAQDTSIDNAVTFLSGKQEENGSWNEEERKKSTDSQESFTALQRVNGGETALNKALQFFAAMAEETNDGLSCKLLILSNSTADVSEQSKTLLARQKKDGGWGLVESKRGAIPDTVQAVKALLASKKAPASAMNNAGDFLVKAQQADGAWIFTDELSLSDTIHTAMVLIVLQDLRGGGYLSGSGLEQATAKAQKYLEAKGAADGSFGTLLDTAWTYLAFCRLKQPSELQSTLSYLRRQQLSNGSWNNTIYDTAICLQALSAIQAPQTDLADLEITEQNISFSPAAPMTGEEVTITAQISNIGNLGVENAKVEFFNGDPRLGGTSIADPQTIQTLAEGGVAVLTAKFTAPATAGPVQVVIFLDRENAIKETSKANNAAAKVLSVGGIPDLAIAAEDITLSDPDVKAFETVDLIVTVRNIGSEPVVNIPIQIYDNDALLTELTLEGVNAASSNKAIITTGFTADTHNIRVMVDPAHSIAAEKNVANNTATASFKIEAEPDKPADIAIESITTTPALPLSTEPTTVTVRIVNLGGTDITDAFAVALSVDGTASGTITVPKLEKGRRAILAFENLTLAAGERTLQAVADGANVITADVNRDNNTMSKTVTVKDSATPADLELVSITATPATANVDAVISFKVLVRNNGTNAADNVEVKLFNGNTALGSGITIPKLVGGQSGELVFEYAFAANGNYSIRAVADPNNKIAEANEADNEKSANVTVSGAADLEITAAAIELSANPAEAFQEITITATVKNLGNQTAVGVPVRFLANGKELATLNLSGVAVNNSNKAILTTKLPKGTYNITVQVDPDKTLANEYNFINNTAYRNLTVNPPVLAGADIVAETLTVSPTLPIQNTETVVTAGIINAGGTDITVPFTVEFKDGATVLNTFTVPSLAAGQRAELKLTTNFAAGDHVLEIVADAGNAVGESNETNNVITQTINVKSDATPADLTVSALTMDKTTANVRDKVAFTAVIENVGTTAAGEFFVRVLVNGEALGEDYKVASLGGGSSFNLQIPYTVLKEGTNSLQVIADVQNGVAESDETNNSRTFDFTAGIIARPDLTIPAEGGLTLNPERPQPSVGFDVVVKVANTGNEAAPAGKLLVSQGHPQEAGSKTLARVDVPAIAAGGNATVNVRLTFAASAENLFFFVDPDDAIIESNEDNNLIRTSVAIEALPDLFVSENSITLSHTDISLGSTVEIKVMVSNVGTLPATATKLLVIRGALDAADRLLLGTLNVPALAAGGTYEGSVLWNAVPGEQKISIVVDPENMVNEISEANNTTTKDVTIDGARLSIIQLFTVPADGSAGTEANSFSAYQDMEIKLTHFWGDNCNLYLFVRDSGDGIFSVTQENGKNYWNTSNAAAGNYKVQLLLLSREDVIKDINGVLTNTAMLLEEQFVNFEITESKELKVTNITSDPTYTFNGKNESIKLTAELLNYSNIDQELSAIIRLKSPDGEVLKTETVTFSVTRKEVRKEIDLGALEYTFTPSGNYQIEVEIQSNGTKMAEMSKEFPVLQTVNIKAVRRVIPETITPEGNRRVKVIIELDGVDQNQAQ